MSVRLGHDSFRDSASQPRSVEIGTESAGSDKERGAGGGAPPGPLVVVLHGVREPGFDLVDARHVRGMCGEKFRNRRCERKHNLPIIFRDIRSCAPKTARLLAGHSRPAPSAGVRCSPPPIPAAG